MQRKCFCAPLVTGWVLLFLTILPLEAQEVVLTAPFSYDENASAAAGAFVLSFDHATTYSQLRSAYTNGQSVLITAFPLPGGRSVDLKLRPTYIMPLGPHARVFDGGDPRTLEPQVAMFTGSALGELGSEAYLAVTDHLAGGSVTSLQTSYALIADAALGSLRGKLKVLETELLVLQPFPGFLPLVSSGCATQPQLRVADIWVEAGSGFSALFPGVPLSERAEAMTEAVLLMFQEISLAYRRDVGLELRLPGCTPQGLCYVNVHTGVAPWDQPLTGGLSSVSLFFRDNPQYYDAPRAAVIFLAGSGGISLGNATACSDVGAYCRAGTMFGLSDTATIAKHELLHLFGAPHDEGLPKLCRGTNSGNSIALSSPCQQQAIRASGWMAPCLQVVTFQRGDWDRNGVFDANDLAAIQTCLKDYRFGLACIEAFDLNGDQRLTPCDEESLRVLIEGPQSSIDCNGNWINDCDDISLGTAQDCNGNGVPDECDLTSCTPDDPLCQDCNANGRPDECDSGNLNSNDRLDVCEILDGSVQDCNANGIPDDADISFFHEPDCNLNLILDACEINTGTTTDCDADGIPDECNQQPDCNSNGIYDACEIRNGTSLDCNRNKVPDECETTATLDCNNNGATDLCDIGSGASEDLNANGIPDECESRHTFHVSASACPNVGSGTEADPYCTIKSALQAVQPEPGAPDGCISFRVARLNNYR